MEPKAEFYDDIITQQPTLTMTSEVITELIDAYMNCFTAAKRDSTTGKVTEECNIVTFFTPAKADLSQIITNLSNIINNLKSDITNLNNNINAKLEQIDSEKELKGVNSGIFSNINTSNSGAKIMIDDYKSVYNSQYYKNVELFIGVILLLGISAKIFRK
jgi:hypothetical protein